MSHDARRVSATILVTSMRGGLAIKSETGGFGGMVGSPIFHHKPPEPANYIDVVQQTQNVTPKYKGVGGWGKRNRDVEAVGGAKVFLCPPAGEAQGQITQMIRSLSSLMIGWIIPWAAGAAGCSYCSVCEQGKMQGHELTR
jgi:hypothetical protein